MTLFTAKQLIQNLLNTDPDKRFNITQVLQHPWIAQNTAVPQTPLCTTGILREEIENWVDVKVPQATFYFTCRSYLFNVIPIS